MEEIKILIQQRRMRLISQETLANHLRITTVTLNRYEKGKREMPFNIAIRYAEYVGFEIKFILKA